MYAVTGSALLEELSGFVVLFSRLELVLDSTGSVVVVDSVLESVVSTLESVVSVVWVLWGVLESNPDFYYEWDSIVDRLNKILGGKWLNAYNGYSIMVCNS